MGDPGETHTRVMAPPNARLCLVGDVVDDEGTLAAAKQFEVPILTSETGEEYALEKSPFVTYFILKDFEGPLFQALSKSPNKVIGPPALKHFAKQSEPLPTTTRPIYNFSMKGVITCFTGIRKREELTRLVNLIHAMGGSIRKDMNSKVTHLICNAAGGDKYKYAITFRLGVVRPAWVEEAWENRDASEFKATADAFTVQHRLKVFEGQRVCFTGFPADEHKHMEEVLRSNGGIPATIDNPECTHVVMSATDPSTTTVLTTTTPGTNPIITNMNSVPQSPLHHPQPHHKLPLLSPSLCDPMTSPAASSPLFHSEPTTTNMHDESVAYCGTEMSFRVEPQRMSTPVNVGAEDEENDPNAMLPIEEEMQCRKTKTCGEDEQVVLPKTVGKRKRESLEMDGSRMGMPSDGRVTRSVKRLKRLNTTAVRKGLRRNLSFTAMKSPFTSLLRRGRSSMMDRSTVSQVEMDDEDMPDCSFIEKSPTFKTPKILPSATNTNQAMVAAVASVAARGATMDGILSRSSLDDTNICLPEIEEEDGANFVVEPTEEGKRASTAAADPGIVDEQYVQARFDGLSSKTFVLKADWFWYTIQNGYADETDYLFGDYLESIANTPGHDRSGMVPLSMNKRKRKRLSQKPIKEECATPKTTGKRRSSVSDAGLLSMSGSFLDCTVSPSKQQHNATRGDDKIGASPALSTPAVKSMRYNHFMDFFQTESNYVGILDIIDKVFKAPLEAMVEGSAAEALLNRSEIKAIFGNFQPIHEVHRNMLSCLTQLYTNWSEGNLIGEVILKHSNDLLKAYPPYVNFFEQMKEALAQCDTQNARFHAFLKINQSKPECGRQSLQDLMIRPVQRLPSISLLLNDILKHTVKENPENPDVKHLNDALTAIKEIMTYINEDKRKTEGQVAMFDIFKQIENCPAHLLSSHRSLVSICEVVELSDLCSGRGHCLNFLLFNDTLEVCKKRSRAFAAKSPNATFNGTLNQRSMQSHTILGASGMGGSGANSGHSKPYKHIKLMPLNTIRLVVDIKDTPRAFALGCRMSKENRDKYYYFNMSEDLDLDKQSYLRSLCKQMAENACRADADNFFATVNSQELDFDVTDFNVGTLSRAFKFANRTRLKVGRAFSFNKTPSKLKRAVSTIMTSPFGSTNSLTPASQMAQMKLASCNNINEIGEIDDEESNVSTATTAEGGGGSSSGGNREMESPMTGMYASRKTQMGGVQ